MKTRLILIVSLILGLAHIHAAEDEGPRISGYAVKDVTLSDAIHKLNKIIAKEHPGKIGLLVAYVRSIYPVDKMEPKVTLKLSKRVPITVVIQYLADMTRSHWRLHDKQVVIYGWLPPNLEAMPEKK